jgi:hypothetical protein
MKSTPEIVVAAGREVAISNPRKVLFPKAGYTKRDLVDYYLAVAAGALRGSGGRPNMLVRYPDGVGAEFFYQKRAPEPRARHGSRSSRSAFPRAVPPTRWSRATRHPLPGSPTSPASSCIRIP